MTLKLMIDPGHDKAKYNQSPVVPAYWEGDRMWVLAGMLRTALGKRGIATAITKTKCDQTIEVSQRGKMGKGCTALISLHSNACADPGVDRPVAIHLVDDNCGPIDEASKALAKCLGETVERVMDTSPAEIYARKSGRDRDGDGRKNDDYYGVLYGAHQVGVPAVILENSFHTNARAAKWLLDDGNLQKLANALADALAAHYGVDQTVVTMQTLQKGDNGAQVEALQTFLIGAGFDCGKWGADGIFGSGTEAALRKFQDEKNINEEGIAGADTWHAILGQEG